MLYFSIFNIASLCKNILSTTILKYRYCITQKEHLKHMGSDWPIHQFEKKFGLIMGEMKTLG